MMAEVEWQKCSNGHLFDPSKNPECPYCPGAVPAEKEDDSEKNQTDSATVINNGGGAGPGGNVKTIMAAGDQTTVQDKADADPGPVSQTVPEGTHVEKAAQSDDSVNNDRMTRVIGVDDAEPVPIFAWLVVLEGDQKYADFRIKKEQVYIGGSQECDIILNDDYVSGEHASIRYRDNGFYITDLDSKNGTFVNKSSENAEPIDRTRLADGDEIQIGPVLLKFKCL